MNYYILVADNSILHSLVLHEKNLVVLRSSLVEVCGVWFRRYTLMKGERMGEELRFLWNATRGNRLRPWRSPYLRWRVETYSGQKADTVRARDFWNLFWNEKRQFFRFLRWTREMKSYSDSGSSS